MNMETRHGTEVVKKLRAGTETLEKAVKRKKKVCDTLSLANDETQHVKKENESQEPTKDFCSFHAPLITRPAFRPARPASTRAAPCRAVPCRAAPSLCRTSSSRDGGNWWGIFHGH
ncbi:hypothetical protein E2C01_071226 [Portunus trituberculatus]|uniref:Uncharacterized protein n=1 Tax=Portunus trituberculatus TaxID=210409 RepID=A0A5B7I7N8_PORTR|nr:hypothetical protein [Portunus trituberculatus]